MAGNSGTPRHLSPLRRLRNLAQEACKAFAETSSLDSSVMDLALGELSGSPWQACQRAAAQAFASKVEHYPGPHSQDVWHEAVACYLVEERGLSLNSLHWVPTLGSKEALIFALARILENSSHQAVAYPALGYATYQRAIESVGGQPRPLPVSTQGILEPWQLPELTSDLAAIFVNYPHNPTQVCVEESYWRKLTDWCRQQNIWLLSDECYVDVTSAPEAWRRTPLLWDAHRTLAFYSLSKRSGLPGLRSGALVGPKAWMEQHELERFHAGLSQPAPLQWASAEAWRDQIWVEQRRLRLKECWQEVQSITKPLGLWPELPGQRFPGFYAWLQHPSWDSLSFAEALAHQGVVGMPGTSLGAPNPSGTLRLTMSLAPSQLPMLHRRLQKACQTRKESFSENKNFSQL